MKEKKVGFYKEKDILGQDKPIDFIKYEDKSFQKKEEKQKIDHSSEYELPSIKTRYISMLIDVVLILVLSLGISALFEKIGEVHYSIRGFTFLIVVILYEPILISIGCTAGQLLTNIRIRKFKDPLRKIRFINAVLRLITKVLLGWISFLTITFNDNRRAIHDYASGSIVIVPK